jgi:ABC-2 type transport system permease protein
MRTALIIARNHTRLVMQDLQLMVFVLVMPVLLTLFLRPAFAILLRAEGFTGANGAEQGIPGAAALFSFNAGIFLAIAIYRDHGWGVWDRLRTTEASALSIVIGMAAPYYVVGVLGMLADFALGDLLFDLDAFAAAGSVVLLCAAYMLCVIGLGLMLAALTRTLQQVAALGQPVATLLAIAGGAFMPLSALPSWAHHIAPASPTYWAMRGFRAALLEGHGVSTALLPALMLVGFATLGVAVTAVRLRPADTKTGWA